MRVTGIIFNLLPGLFLLIQGSAVDTTVNREREASRWLSATTTPDRHMMVFNQLLREVKHLLPQGDTQEQFEKYVSRRVDSNSQALFNKAKKVLLRHFTAEELRFMADYESSPLRKRVNEKMGRYEEDMRSEVIDSTTRVVKGFTTELERKQKRHGEKDKEHVCAAPAPAADGKKTTTTTTTGGKRRALVAVEQRRGGHTTMGGRCLVPLPRTPPRWLSFFRGGVEDNSAIPVAELI